MEFYAKAPNKRLIVMKIEGMGEILQGFDGTSAWAVTPGGPMEITGDQLEETRRDSTFNAELKWKELYPTAEVKGKEKVGERDTYVIELTPKDGKVVKRFYDTQTFLLVRAIMNRTTPQGPVDITADFSDYREVGGGVKAPFSLKQSMAMGDIVMTFTEMKNNVEIDDAKFSKPAK
jgi:outer membrane lipoprotein-sorting protein